MPPAVAPSAPTPTHAELHLQLELAPGSTSALLRVVSALHRRRCRVTAASFTGGSGACDRLELRVQAPGFYAPQIEVWLRALVDVRRAVALPSD